MILYNIILYIIYYIYIIYVLYVLYYVIILQYHMFIFVFIYLYIYIYKGSGQWQFIHLSEPSKHKFREEITSQDNVISSLNLFQNGPLFQASNLESPRPVWDALFEPQTGNLLPESEESAEAATELEYGGVITPRATYHLSMENYYGSWRFPSSEALCLEARRGLLCTEPLCPLCTEPSETVNTMYRALRH